MKFDKNYTNYWATAVNKSVDGTIIAGVKEASHFLPSLGINRYDRVLDLGCSFGRMFEALAIYSDQIVGIDPDPYAVERAAFFNYLEVRVGRAEQTEFDAESFDALFCWAVFDVVNHCNGFKEINRILKTNGKLLLTGKNSNYFEDDILAFKAEKNAYLKGFPNKFTNLNVIFNNLNSLGFNLDKLYVFPKRGDLGVLKYIDYGNKILNLYRGYEYLLICHKVDDYNSDVINSLDFDSPFSQTALARAKKAGFQNPSDFFESLGVD